MGDAVMAAFQQPAAAMRAMLKAQQAIASAAHSPSLVLKVGLHFGPTIAVTLDNRLDYFGTTVNVAARLEGLSSGGDLIISDTVRNDPEVLELLQASNLVTESFAATLKGLGTDQIRVWRVTA